MSTVRQVCNYTYMLTLDHYIGSFGTTGKLKGSRESHAGSINNSPYL